MKQIKGTITYKDIETGFWAIEGHDGGKWRPVNLPDNLKKEGVKGTFQVKEVDEMASVIMWGTPVKVLNYSTEETHG